MATDLFFGGNFFAGSPPRDGHPPLGGNLGVRGKSGEEGVGHSSRSSQSQAGELGKLCTALGSGSVAVLDSGALGGSAGATS